MDVCELSGRRSWVDPRLYWKETTEGGIDSEAVLAFVNAGRCMGLVLVRRRELSAVLHTSPLLSKTCVPKGVHSTAKGRAGRVAGEKEVGATPAEERDEARSKGPVESSECPENPLRPHV